MLLIDCTLFPMVLTEHPTKWQHLLLNEYTLHNVQKHLKSRYQVDSTNTQVVGSFFALKFNADVALQIQRTDP